MKKLFAIILSAVMLLSFAACGGNEAPVETTTTPVTDAPTEDMNQPAAPGEGPDMPAVDTPAVDGGEVSDGTSAAQTLLNVFYDELAANPSATAEDLANKVIAHESIQFMPMVVPMEEGYLTGFNNEIKGFEEAYTFAPGIGTIPFVGYIFKLADGADVEAFKTTLETEANLRWNICTAAEEMVCENVGNTVFFLMCPVSLAG
ncbi:MAG: hypothetical protein IKB88_01140 [Clostridia bacterium]|nr:hypothetical protein [Clostridia bacterium]